MFRKKMSTKGNDKRRQYLNNVNYDEKINTFKIVLNGYMCYCFVYMVYVKIMYIEIR